MHPAIVISNDIVYQNEGIYICVMVKHSNLHEYFAFDLIPEMFVSSKNIPAGKAKAHLIAYVLENQIISNSNTKRNKMKSIYVDKLVHFISDTVVFDG